MRNKTFFRGIVGVLFVGAMFASCVQNDLYDDLYDDDMSMEVMIGKRKIKGDGSVTYDPAFALEWVKNCNSPAPAECAAASMSRLTGKDITKVRFAIGMESSYYYDCHANWAMIYYNDVHDKGIHLNSKSEIDAIAQWGGLSFKGGVNAIWNLCSNNGNGCYEPPYNSVLVIVRETEEIYHWGVLRTVKKNLGRIEVADQCGFTTIHSLNDIQYVYSK